MPDSVTFIQVPPKSFHVSVRDKGSSLLRTSVINYPVVDIDFKDYASEGVLRVTHADIMSALKRTFGGSAQFPAVGLDSLRVNYVTGKGKKVPIVVVADLSTDAGNVISTSPLTAIPRVEVYGDKNIVDTITRVFTTKIVKKNLSESVDVNVKLQKIPGVRIIPDEIGVKIKVEPLVSKDYMVDVEAIGVPDGINLLLFPSKVRVNCFVPMSEFSTENPDIKVYVDYNDISNVGDGNLPLKVSSLMTNVRNINLDTKSVEYTIVK